MAWTVDKADWFVVDGCVSITEEDGGVFEDFLAVSESGYSA